MAVRLQHEQPTRMHLPRTHRAQPPGKHRAQVLSRSPPTFPRQPSHPSEPKEAIVLTAGRWTRKGTSSSTQAVRHCTLRVPLTVALHVFAIRHGCSLACARLCTALLCVHVCSPALKNVKTRKRGRAALAAVTGGQLLLSACPGSRRQLCPQPGPGGDQPPPPSGSGTIWSGVNPAAVPGAAE